ncbi:hypothetical protein [Flavimarina sp. Hel_I_48]|uniref:hypothetical protein n=1 Tax=Flavimarina sp. Hel_I_48 TaxID=1392488 RepID=UPI0006902AF1|nr:hypothetical protein [Flavimarina sp. Hel_I_48]
MENEFVIEAYPDRIQAKIEKKEREKRQFVPGYIFGNALELVLDDLKLWRVGTLTVSFKGGDAGLHQKIAETANIWTEYGNITFDFGFDQSTGNYRQWSPDDRSHIRVGFEYEGYWSLVGNDSADPAILGPGEITLNLSDFDKRLPSDWAATTLHEFGHALGFQHEHQSPAYTCDFDWPSLYDYLGGAPNYWTKAKVDHNLRQLQEGGLTFSAHDKNSIMHYSFPAWMFISKEESPCFTAVNTELSEEDKRMMQIAYPFEDDRIQKKDKERMGALKELVAMSRNDSDINHFHKRHLDYYEKKAV